MIEIQSRIKVGDTVWWVHCSSGIYCNVFDGVVQAITLCEYQGALYCEIFSPSFKINPYPTVHYSNVFLSEDSAKEFAKYQMENPEDLFPMCMGCHYARGAHGMMDTSTASNADNPLIEGASIDIEEHLKTWENELSRKIDEAWGFESKYSGN